MRLSQEEGDLRLLAKNLPFRIRISRSPAGRPKIKEGGEYVEGNWASCSIRIQEKRRNRDEYKQASTYPDALLAGSLWPALTHPDTRTNKGAGGISGSV